MSNMKTSRYFPAPVMPVIKPFAALRPKPELAKQICALPYDVISSEEARALTRNNPYSFLHISKPEIDLESGIDVYSEAVYKKGAENFQLLLDQGALVQDARPCFYLYRQIMNEHVQVGLAAVASCQEYEEGIIKKHELTRPAKEDDRVRHIEALNSQTGPVFLACRTSAEYDAFTDRIISGSPDIEVLASDGVQHASWIVDRDEDIAFIDQQFLGIDFLYVADGHHRTAAASRVNISRKGAGQSGWFLAVIFPYDQIQILPYNRVIKDLNGRDAVQFLSELEGIFNIAENHNGECSSTNEFGLYLGGQWRGLQFKVDTRKLKASVDDLDVRLLQNHVLEPLLGVGDPRTSDRIGYIGGIHGVSELERLVDNGQYACAFSLFPTNIEDLMRIAAEDGLMPPKSTWFEPKLRDGMFCHMI